MRPPTADVRMWGCGCGWWSDHTPLSALLLFNRSTRDVIQWNLTARKFYLWIQFFSSMIHSSIGLFNYRLTISIDKFRHLKYRLPSAELLESNEILLAVNWLISTIDMKNIDYYLTNRFSPLNVWFIIPRKFKWCFKNHRLVRNFIAMGTIRLVDVIRLG